MPREQDNMFSQLLPLLYNYLSFGYEDFFFYDHIHSLAYTYSEKGLEFIILNEHFCSAFSTKYGLIHPLKKAMLECKLSNCILVIHLVVQVM